MAGRRGGRIGVAGLRLVAAMALLLGGAATAPTVTANEPASVELERNTVVEASSPHRPPGLDVAAEASGGRISAPDPWDPAPETEPFANDPEIVETTETIDAPVAMERAGDPIAEPEADAGGDVPTDPVATTEDVTPETDVSDAEAPQPQDVAAEATDGTDARSSELPDPDASESAAAPAPTAAPNPAPGRQNTISPTTKATDTTGTIGDEEVPSPAATRTAVDLADDAWHDPEPEAASATGTTAGLPHRAAEPGAEPAKIETRTATALGPAAASLPRIGFVELTRSVDVTPPGPSLSDGPAATALLTTGVVAAGQRVSTAVSVAMDFARLSGGWAGPLVFHVWLRRQLRERRMSQRQLGVISGVNHSTISRLVSGTRAPTLETAAKLVHALRHEWSEDQVATYFDLLPERTLFPTQRVESALRGDPELDDGDVRTLMERYLAMRRQQRRAVARGRDGPPSDAVASRFTASGRGSRSDP